MSTWLFSLFCVLMIILMSQPMFMLIILMFSMSSIIVWMYYITNDYWTSFMMTMSFLVGLFLLFIYMVSLSQYIDNKMKKKLNLFFLVWIFFTMFYIEKIFVSKISYKNMDFNSWYYWLFENNFTMVFMALLVFLLIFFSVYLMMKKNKKNMKSSY